MSLRRAKLRRRAVLLGAFSWASAFLVFPFALLLALTLGAGELSVGGVFRSVRRFFRLLYAGRLSRRATLHAVSKGSVQMPPLPPSGIPPAAKARSTAPTQSHSDA